MQNINLVAISLKSTTGLHNMCT